MANTIVVNALGSAVYLKSSGAGTDGDPHIPSHVVDSLTAALPAGTNNIGDADILTLVGDNVDMDSGAGADNHAGVAVLLPGAGGHVVGGVAANPFRVDPVASTVQPVSVASWFTGAGVVASVAGVPTVVASVIGAPSVLASIPNIAGVSVASFYVPVIVNASIPNVSPVSVASWFAGAGVVASVAGVPSVGLASWFPGADVVASIVGNPSVLASIPNVSNVAIASWFTGAGVVASVIGNPAVIASVAGNPAVIASIAGLPAVAVASITAFTRPYTILSQWSTIARVVASVGVAAAQAAPGANLYNIVTGLSVINAAASYGGAVNVCDGTGTLHVGYALIGGGYVRTFPAGLKPAANATVFVSIPTYSLDLYVSMDGFVGA